MPILQTEFDTYQALLSNMLTKHEGQFVVIKGSNLAHFSETYEQALNWAYEKFGLDDFFVKRVASDHDVVHFTRDIGPCHQ